MANIDTEKTPNETAEHKSGESFSSHLHVFLENTTAHGFARLAASRGIYWRAFWILMCIGAHFAFYFQTYVIIEKFFQRPLRTRVSMEHGKKLKFPAITLCNRNILRKSRIPPKLAAEITNILHTSPEYSKINRSHKSGSALPSSKEMHPDRFISDSISELVTKYEPRELNDMGHQVDDVVIDCAFNGEDCGDFSDKSIWRHIWIEEVGNCFMFNRALDHHGNRVDPYHSVLAGNVNGLSLLLNIEQYEYINGISPYAGMLLVIGSQGQMPFPLSNGISVSPGLSTGIELRMHDALRLDPFGNRSCEKTGELSDSNIYKALNMSYSKMACKLSCLNNMQITKCKCSQFYTVNSEYEYCSIRNKSVVECLDGVYNSFLDGACEKQCPAPCQDIHFTTTISSSKWPAKNYESHLHKKIKSLKNMSMTLEEISNNLLELRIYYADLDYIHIRESLKYEVQDILSNIGGQLGMWIGVSVLTIAEVIELICITMNYVMNKYKKKNNSVQDIHAS